MAEKELGKKIAQLREQQKIKQADLAKMAEISRTYLSMIESGKADNVSTSVLKKISLALNVSASSLISQLQETVNLTIEPSLREFAVNKKIDYRMIEILNNLEFSGNKPSSPSEWESLYYAIKDVLEGFGSKQ